MNARDPAAGVWIEPVPGGADEPALMMRHPANPFVKPWPASKTLHELAFDYVSTYAQTLKLKPGWISGLERAPLKKWKVNPTPKLPGGLVLRWLPIDPKDPRSSFMVERQQTGGPKDQSAVLLAGLGLDQSNANEVYIAGIRLRVVLHVSGQGATRQVRFTGMSRSYGEAEGVELEGPAFVTLKLIAGGNKKPVTAEVFPQDPASHGGVANSVARRPSRLSNALKPAQKVVSLGNLRVKANRATLEDADLRVMNSGLVPGDGPRDETKEVAVKKVGPKWQLLQTAARTDDFAAVSAYYHGHRMFERMISYGIDVPAYFRWAELPVCVHYRGVLRGSDGRVRNAEVVWDAALKPDFASGARGRVLIRFGLADVSISPANFPLGMSTDVRWSWHEYGHVLLMASVGEREFRFAHSAGDSLAAILSDPASQLTANAGWRGVTFPWVQMKRRHDRQPADGWAWDGVLDRPDQGYWKEQILSSTLFRLYRLLGGDAVSGGQPDKAAREAAADHTAFLIMQAIGLFGAAAIVPASSADQFVSALMDADIGSSKFLLPGVSASAFAASPPRVGGTAYKLVRWAFEQQGLYAPAASKGLVIGPGDPPSIDVYIASSLNGGYACGPATSYRIQATNPVHNSANGVQVVVGNRGASQATGAKVGLWAAPINAAVPDWQHASWIKADEKPTMIPGHSPGVAVTLQWTPNAPGPYALLADVTCDEDRSNIRPETQLPCALLGAPMAQLLGGDNNLGLVEVAVT